MLNSGDQRKRFLTTELGPGCGAILSNTSLQTNWEVTPGLV